MHAQELKKAYMFFEISKILGRNNELFSYFNLRENSKWNDLQSYEKKEDIRKKLKLLACQQQQILKLKEVSIKDILFPEIEKMNVVEDYSILRLYLNSRIEYNRREYSKHCPCVGISTSKLFMDILTKNSTVVAVTTDLNATVDMLPAMRSKDFWANRLLINVDEVSYFPVKWGFNISLSEILCKTNNILIAL